VDAYDRDDTTKIAAGKLLTIDNQIDTTTGTYKLKSEFSNERETLFPKPVCERAPCWVDTKRNLTVVPRPRRFSAVPQGTYVYSGSEGQLGEDSAGYDSAFLSGNSAGIATGLQPGDKRGWWMGRISLQDGSKIEGAPARPGAQ